MVALGAVALLNDTASEMIYPLLPAFLATLGGGPGALGLIEGVADATAGLFKLFSGYAADRVGRLKEITLAGYVLANLLRPMMALATAWGHIFLIRFGDRAGKGIRTSARDALLAAATPADMRGRAFGFHRAMDHAGAFLGPSLALIVIGSGIPMRHLFAWTVVPGALAVAVLVLHVKEAPVRQLGGQIDLALPPQPAYRRLLLAVSVFALGNSSDAFLLWRARELGLAVKWLPLLWILLHVVKSATATWGGTLSDRVGRRLPILVGWGVYAAVYLGFGFAGALWQLWVLMALYGVYFGLTEGVEKAFVVDLVATEWRGRALGAYHTSVGLCALPASVLFGGLYRAAGPAWAFGLGAALAAAAAALLPRAATPGPALR